MSKQQTKEGKFFAPVDVPLGEPKRKFSETFDGLQMVIEHFNLKTINNKKIED